MKICRFTHDNKIKTGCLKDGLIFPDAESALPYSSEMIDFATAEYFQKTDVIFLPPSLPSKIVGVGRNYASHAAELDNDVPKEPLLFLKAPSALIIDGENIKIPEQSTQVEHEGELAVIIKRVCRNLTIDADPFDYVLGYACLNDVTARDIQRREIQFTRAKSFNTFCPISIFVETELDAADLKITTRVNGVEKQAGRTSEMVFSVSTLIKYISRQMTLVPGDIIATGTPSGVSKLNSGDLCEVEIESVGVLTNSVVA